VGQSTNTLYKLGDIVAVRLVEAAPLTGGLRFDLAETGSAHRLVRQPKLPRTRFRRSRR
jgi:ribonuclease R